MIEQDDQSVTVTVDADVPAATLFAILGNATRHTEIDGSGMLRGADPTSPVPVTSTGEVFVMEMFQPALGEYRTENHVVEFEQDRLITWTTGVEGNPPAGVWWTWRLEPLAGGRTAITHRYDWSRVTDPGVLERVTFPRVQPDQLLDTVTRLIAAAQTSNGAP